MDELIIDGQVFVPSRRAAEITGYAKDYIGQLCREGRVEAKLVGRSWYVLETSLREHRFGAEGDSKAEDTVVESVPVVVADPETTETWESPSYTTEEAPEMVPLNRPNYLENTAQNSEIAEEEKGSPVEAAWEDWYAKSGKPETPVVEEPVLSEVEPEPIPEPVIEEERPRIIRNIPGSMDIGPKIHRELQEAASMPEARVIRERRLKRPRKAGKPMSTRIPKALFCAYVIVVVTIVMIGTGLLESVPENQVTDFLSGTDRIGE